VKRDDDPKLRELLALAAPLVDPNLVLAASQRDELLIDLAAAKRRITELEARIAELETQLIRERFR
jgi:hypothetical protein